MPTFTLILCLTVLITRFIMIYSEYGYRDRPKQSNPWKKIWYRRRIDYVKET